MIRFISRPFEPTGMTTETWRSVPVADVEIEDLLFCQEIAHIPSLLTDDTTDEPPHVVQWHGNLYLSDGHHRVVRAVMRGETTIAVRLLDMDVAR